MGKGGKTVLFVECCFWKGLISLQCRRRYQESPREQSRGEGCSAAPIYGNKKMINHDNTMFKE